MTTYTTTAIADPHTVTVTDDPDLVQITITEADVTLNLDPVEFTAAVTSVAGKIGAVTLDTDDVSEGSNLYYTDARFDTRLATKDTDDVAEGSNLYYTDGRFDARLATKDTDDLQEGASNLYYTNARFDTRLATKTTSDVAEGTNLYYTDARADARAQLKIDALVDGAPGTLDTLNELAAAINDDADVYNTLNGLITTNASNIALKFNTADFNSTFDTRLATKTTSDVAEGTNLYYTQSRFNTAFGLKDTDALGEGSTNLYYTDARANSAIDTRVTGAFIDGLDTVSDGGTY